MVDLTCRMGIKEKLMSGTKAGASCDPFDRFLSGEILFGDNFGPEAVADWHRDEREAYSSMIECSLGEYVYEYHELNKHHFFKNLDKNRKFRVVGFGSALGEELAPIIDLITQLIIVEPSKRFVRESLQGLPVQYVCPSDMGAIPLDDGAADLISCFDVLHHIPNVSFVLKELWRVLSVGGVLLLREPIVSMGDWRLPRSGLTARERGIPLGILSQILRDCGFSISYQALACFAPLRVLSLMLHRNPYNSGFFVAADALVSRPLKNRLLARTDPRR